MIQEFTAAFFRFVGRVQNFLKDPLLETTLDAEIAAVPAYGRETVYLFVGAIALSLGLQAMFYVPADLAHKLLFGTAVAGFAALLSLYGIMVGHLLVRALGSGLTRLEYASTLIHDLPATLFIYVICMIAGAVGAVSGALPLFVFTSMIQVVPFYRMMLLSGVRKDRAAMATLVIFGFFFVVGLSYGVAVGTGASAIPPYAVDVNVDGASVYVGGGQ